MSGPGEDRHASSPCPNYRLDCRPLMSRDDDLSEDGSSPGITGGRDTTNKLHAATRLLAGGTGPLKARLRAAFTAELMALRPEDFPWPDLGVRWGAILEELAPNHRPIITLEPWWDFELSHIAEEIVDIYDEAARRAGSDPGASPLRD